MKPRAPSFAVNPDSIAIVNALQIDEDIASRL
jgi:hypothetical protein